MEKIMSLKEFQGLASQNAFRYALVEEFQYNPDTPVKDVAVYFYFTEDSIEKTATKCCDCKTVTVEEGKIFTKNYIDCPVCGKKKLLLKYGYNLQTNDVKSFCKKLDGGFVLGKIGKRIHSKGLFDTTFENGKENDWLLEGISEESVLENITFFSKKVGFRQFDKLSARFYSFYNYQASYPFRGLPLPDSDDFKELYSIWKDTLVESGIYKPEFEKTVNTLYEFIRLYEDAASIIKKNAVATRIPKKTATLEDNLKPIPVDNIQEFFSGQNALTAITGVNGALINYSIACQCGEIIKSSCKKQTYSLPSVTHVCPKCKRTIHVGLKDYSKRCIDFLYWEKQDDCVIARLSSVTASIKEDAINFNVDELQRVYLYPKKYVVYKKKDDVWEKKTATSMSVKDIYTTLKCLNTNEELEEIVNTSFLKYSGVEQAWGLGEFSDFAIEEAGTLYKLSYLYEWYKNPFLEILVKAKLHNITRQILMKLSYSGYSLDSDINPDGKKPSEILGISKNTFKIIREFDSNIGEMRMIDSLCTEYPEFNKDMWGVVYRENLGISFLTTCRDTGTSPKRLLDYLESCYNNQCIEKGAALTIFSDYYRMAKDIGFNLNDKHIKFPNSLKKEHDKASFAYKVVEDEIKTRHFVENTKQSEQLYSFRNNDYVVIFPNSPDEVVFEGQALNHCVSSYVTLIEKGRTCICFIRRKDALDIPYFTCEIRDETIYQVKGMCNQYPNTKELVDFIHDWATNKNLQEEYTHH